MKKRDIILDFTSLLDVTLIVIFFFVLFSHLDGQANKARTDEKIQELETAVQQAETREAKAKELEENLQKDLNTVKESNKRQGANINEIISFRSSDNLKLLLDVESDSWKVRIIKNNEMIDMISDSDSFDEKLMKAFEDAGLTNDNTILCDFVYNGEIPGTHAAYKKVKNGLAAVQQDYNFLYISETDLSIGE